MSLYVRHINNDRSHERGRRLYVMQNNNKIGQEAGRIHVINNGIQVMGKDMRPDMVDYDWLLYIYISGCGLQIDVKVSDRRTQIKAAMTIFETVISLIQKEAISQDVQSAVL